jgi:excisionase family DNA binding protein
MYKKQLTFTLSTLFFLSKEIESLAEVARRERGWFRIESVGKRFGVKSTVVKKWIQSGLLKPTATVMRTAYFDQNAIKAFADEYIFTEEAAKILEVRKLTVQKWARTGRLKPVTSTGINTCHRYLFRRTDVEQFRAQNRLTAPQMARRLGISRSQVVQWIKRGKIKPNSGPGIDGSKHYLFLVPDD